MSKFRFVWCLSDTIFCLSVALHLTVFFLLFVRYFKPSFVRSPAGKILALIDCQERNFCTQTLFSQFNWKEGLLSSYNVHQRLCANYVNFRKLITSHWCYNKEMLWPAIRSQKSRNDIGKRANPTSCYFQMPNFQKNNGIAFFFTLLQSMETL